LPYGSSKRHHSRKPHRHSKPPDQQHRPKRRSRGDVYDLWLEPARKAQTRRMKNHHHRGNGGISAL
jgi:hypothetical protein